MRGEGNNWNQINWNEIQHERDETFEILPNSILKGRTHVIIRMTIVGKKGERRLKWEERGILGRLNLLGSEELVLVYRGRNNRKKEQQGSSGRAFDG